MKHSTINLLTSILAVAYATGWVIKVESPIQRETMMIMAVVFLVSGQILRAIEKREKTNE